MSVFFDYGKINEEELSDINLNNKDNRRKGINRNSIIKTQNTNKKSLKDCLIKELNPSEKIKYI